MKNKLNYIIITIFFFIIIIVLYKIFFSNKIAILDNRAKNVINNIDINKTDNELQEWKKNEIENYKYSTNLEFLSGSIVNINLEAREVELELIPGVKTIMNTYNTGSNLEPLILKAKKGDKIVVNFKNSLKQETTVHWHGIRVPNNQDGVPGVTQDPIKPGEKYNYTFVVNDAGTFIFHPHKNHSEQIGKGLYGLLIVEDDMQPKYDKEFEWVLKDYRVNKDGTLDENFDNMMDKTHGGRIGNILTINNIVSKQVNVNPGDLIRLRLANMSNARIYNLDLSEFDAKVIATDDSLVNNPKKVYELEMGPGERYDLEIKIPKNFSGQLKLTDHYFSRYPKNNLAIFNVLGTNKENNSINMPIGKLPNWGTAKYNKPDIVIDIGGMGVMGGDKGMIGGERGWTINDGIFPKTNKPIKLKKGKMYIIRMMNNTRRDHPMHLHGDFFQVISVNGSKGEFIGWKDTVNVKLKEFIDVAIIPTNTGSWAFHCHILEHADLGMFTTVDVEN